MVATDKEWLRWNTSMVIPPEATQVCRLLRREEQGLH